MNHCKILASVLLVLVSAQLLAQQGKGKSKPGKLSELSPENIEWGEGSIMLNDGNELKGLVKYNDKNGVLSYENGNDSRSFTARSVLGFEVYDNVARQQRVFFSLEYEDPKNSTSRPHFFELIKDLKFFAVVSKKDPVSMKERQAAPAGFSSSGFGVAVGGMTETIYKQTETIYLLNTNGKVDPYLTLTQKDTDGAWFDSSNSKNKVVGKNLLSEYIGEDFSLIESYANQNRLSFKKKEDLLKIFDYYDQLLKERNN
ncbi:MAG: hypothetical protein KF845_14870 [Cyclobacteriaceae bacterium]|nr:hypothetical protein [Cyclobacteriaceae bacterium]